MDIIFMNPKNSETSDPHRLILNLPDKINLKKSDKYVSLSNVSICYAFKDIRTSYKNNEFKTSAPIWNDEFKQGSWQKINHKIYETMPSKS